jgi:hypothetical protein
MYSKITKGRVLVAASTYKGGDADYYCDGHADERFINAAIQYLSENFDGGIVTLSEGEFDIAGYIDNSYSNIVIQGYGPQTVLNCSSAACGIRVLGDSSTHTSRNVVRDLKVTKTAAGIIAMITFQYTDYGTIENCYIDNAYYYGVLVNTCDHLIVSHNYFTRQGVTAIQVWGSDYGIIDGNQFTGGSTWGQAPAIVIDAATSGNYYLNITNNIIYDFTTDANHFYGIRNNSYYCNISNNIITDLVNTDGDIFALATYLLSLDSVVSGNVIEDISAETAGMPACGIYIYVSSRVNVVNNKVINVKNVATAEDGIGIFLTSFSEQQDNIVNSNGIYNCSGYGIYIDTDIIRTRVVGNAAVNNGNLIDRWGCDSSTTAPMLLGEAAPLLVNATWAFTATGASEGLGVYRFTKDTSATSQMFFVDNVNPGDYHGMIPGVQYTYTLYAKVSVSTYGPFGGIRVYEQTTGGGTLSTITAMAATTGWQNVYLTATVYASVTNACFGVWASTSFPTTSFIDIDRVRFYQVATGNDHERNFYDGGTDTASVNSWS